MNLGDVAKRAGVSTATVSRVLNDVGFVKASTRTRVLKAIRDLNYYPNVHAQRLAAGTSRTLGMIVSKLENPFFSDIFGALESKARRHGYDVLVANTDYRTTQLVSNVHLMLGRRLAGLALVVSEMQPAVIEELVSCRLPIVFYDVGVAKGNVTNIRVRYERGMLKIVEYLHALGHRRLAFVGHHTGLEPLQNRKKSFLDAASRLLSPDEFTTVQSADGPVGGRQAGRHLLASSFKPTAIICVNDFMALGVLRELRDQGLRVPDDVSVTGFDNIGLSEFACPSLTTAHIPRERIGALIFDSLVPDEAGSNIMGQEIVIDPEFLVRESTGPAPPQFSARRQTSERRL